MRPQHDAAENTFASMSPHSSETASMRPQHDAAENLQKPFYNVIMSPSFNEAAA